VASRSVATLSRPFAQFERSPTAMQRLTGGTGLAVPRGDSRDHCPMLKITRETVAGSTHVMVSGRIGAPQVPDLRRFLEAENASTVVLDLTEVSLVDVEVVQFLLECEAHGVGLVGCPAYIREWMVRERSSQ